MSDKEELVFDIHCLAAYLVVGENHWGRGYSKGEALRNARKPKEYIVFRVNGDPRRATIGGMFGDLTYHNEDGYALVEQVRAKDSKIEKIELRVVKPEKKKEEETASK